MPETWTVSCTARQYEWLRSDDAFAVIVSLARSVNHIRFATHGLFALEGEDSTPFLARQMTSAIMSAGATLFEGVRFARKHVRRRFARHRDYRALEATWKNPDNALLLERHLSALRHKAVSHFDPSEVRRLLEQLALDGECIFANGQADDSRHLHYRLADAVAIMTLVGPVPDEATLNAEYRRLLRQTARFSRDFTYAADALIGGVLADYGFVVNE